MSDVLKRCHLGVGCVAYEDCDVGSCVVWDAVLAAYEACARIAEDEGECRHVEHAQGFCACQSKAAAIRARAQEKIPDL